MRILFRVLSSFKVITLICNSNTVTFSLSVYDSDALDWCDVRNRVQRSTNTVKYGWESDVRFSRGYRIILIGQQRVEYVSHIIHYHYVIAMICK